MSIADVPIVEFHLVSPNVEEGARTLLDSCPDATAILAMSDRQAGAILAEAKRRNIDVPKDLSVVGFDDAENAALADPALTTIAQPIVEKGRIAARVLFEGAPPGQVVLPTQLVVRASTAPPRAR